MDGFSEGPINPTLISRAECPIFCSGRRAGESQLLTQYRLACDAGITPASIEAPSPAIGHDLLAVENQNLQTG